MSLSLPHPYVGGPMAEQFTPEKPAEFARQLEARFDELQGNFEKLARTFPLGTEHFKGTYKTAFPFSAGWANYGNPWEDATYSKVGRLVVLQGLVTKSGGVPGAGDVIGVLPAGYRPTEDLMFAVATGGTNAFGRVDVQVDGEVVWQVGSVDGTDHTSLSGISFLVDA